jgi:hypothetical protein
MLPNIRTYLSFHPKTKRITVSARNINVNARKVDFSGR